MKCSKCKAKLKKNMRYCPDCGTKVVRRSKRWISVLLVISLFVGTAFGGWTIGIALAKRVLGPSDKLDNVKINSAEAAIAFSKELGKELGYENALSELTEKITTTVDGDSYYRLQQNYQGIPVYGKNVVYATDSHGSVTSVTGNVVDVTQTINVNPTITQSQLMDSIKKYVEENLQIDSIDGLIPDELKGNLCIVITPESGTSYLAYEVQIGGYKVLIDAHSAEILTSSSTIMSELTGKQTVLGYKASDVAKENGFPIDKKTDDYYIMRDTEKNISVYTLNNRNSMNGKVFEPSRGSIVESTDTIFGNSEVEAELEYETGAQLLINVIKIYEYFSELGFIPSVPKINLYYNDGYDSGNNALGGADAEYAMVSMGSNTGVNCVDAIAHEYTHFVSREIVDWIGASENGALNEAFSDIFGVMIEAKVKKNEIDWNMFNLRNVADPSSQGYPETLANENNSGEDYVHGYSTVISHAAYLMWNGIDGRESYKINADDLAKLWYRAMLMMPSDCNFIECRHLVELAAHSMKSLTDEQINCVSEAFDSVGIYSDNPIEAELTYALQPNSTLSVLDKDGQQYSEYTLVIEGLKKTILWHENSDGMQEEYWGSMEYIRSIEVNEVPMVLNLPNGYYTFTISDRYHPELSYSFSASIGKSGLDKEVILYTAFEKPLIVKLTEPTAEETPSPDITGIYAQLPKLFSCITASGSANWELMPSSDGSFDSILKVFDWGDNKPEYPNGTCYIRETSGIFTGLEKINDYSYRMVADRIEKIGKEGDTYIADDMRYIVEDGTGIDARDEFYLYLPGTPRSVFPQGLIDSVQNNGFHSMDEITQNTYVLYHPIPESNGYDPVFIGTSNNPAEQAESGIDMASTFGFDKAWDIHDKSGAEHMVTSLAFCEDGTFYCMVGYYLSDSAVNFRGTYLTKEDEITLQYTLNGAQTVCSYRVDWENRTLTQTSQENLIIPHQIGSKYQFEENTWLTAEGLRDKVEMYPGFLNS